MKKILSSLLAVMFLLSGISNVNAVDSLSEFDNDELNELYDFFIKNEVGDEVAKSLVKKVECGEVLDSINPSYQDKGVIKTLENGEKVTFPDGSIRITTIEAVSCLENSIQPFSISGGTWNSGTTWWERTGLKVEENMGSLKARFYMDCNGNAYGPSSISKAYDWVVDMVGGTWSNAKLTIYRKSATLSEPAIARLQFTYNILGIGTVNRRIEGCVKGSNVYSQSSVF